MTAEVPRPTTDPDGADDPLAQAIDRSLDAALRALDLETVDDDRFRVALEPGPFDRAFGGQTLAQAVVAASATVSDKPPHALHAFFVDAGSPGEPVELEVGRVRDGRSFSTRRVAVRQGDRDVLSAIVSFHDNPDGPEAEPVAPTAPAPHDLPRLQDWVDGAPPELRPHAELWAELPPPVEMRIGEPPTFFGGSRAEGPRSHWMRLPREVGDDPVLHAALLVYASDYLLLDMAFRSRPGPTGPLAVTGTSLDHSLWLHRPVRFDRWHLYTQETVALAGHRGLVRGSIHDDDGRLVASVAQETLVRPRR